MTAKLRWLRSSMLFLAAIPLLASTIAPRSADAATSLWIAANQIAEIWKINPADGSKISGFDLIPKTSGLKVGLAFDGTYLYYTDENRAEIDVYTTAGVLDRTLPKPTLSQPGAGLGASKTSLFVVDTNSTITEIDSFTGAVIQHFLILGIQNALTFAGARESLFVNLNDSTTLLELSPTGTPKGSITVPSIFRGLAYSSSSKLLYGTLGGLLWVVDPDTGNAVSPDYPVVIHDDVTQTVIAKAGGAAADEPILELCGDEIVNVDGETCDPPGSTQTNGAICRPDCTYCGDGVADGDVEQCDDGNTVNEDNCRNDCTLPRCGDGTKDPNEQCDDGNNDDGDGCSAECTTEPFCGDGIIQPELLEQCEPPNTPGCDATCHSAEICNDLDDNDNDGLIDCLDPDCDCLPIGRDPGNIRFSQSGAGDFLTVHGALDPETPINPLNDVISFLLTNANGKIFELEIPSGDVKRIGRNLFRYRNSLAQINRDGLARFSLRYFPRRQSFTFEVKAYGDLSKATVAAMNFQVAIGDDAFLNQSVWRQKPYGWLLVLPGE